MNVYLVHYAIFQTLPESEKASRSFELHTYSSQVDSGKYPRPFLTYCTYSYLVPRAQTMRLHSLVPRLFPRTEKEVS